LITDGHGIPLAVSLTGGNRNDVTQLMPLIQAVSPVRAGRGRPRRLPPFVFSGGQLVGAVSCREGWVVPRRVYRWCSGTRSDGGWTVRVMGGG